jgi:hypothetical protein
MNKGHSGFLTVVQSSVVLYQLTSIESYTWRAQAGIHLQHDQAAEPPSQPMLRNPVQHRAQSAVNTTQHPSWINQHNAVIQRDRRPHESRRGPDGTRHVVWAHPVEYSKTPRTSSGILRSSNTRVNSPGPNLTPAFSLQFEFAGESYNAPFPGVENPGSLLERFERRIVWTVGRDQQDAIRAALACGYALQCGYWGRTIIRGIRGPDVEFPEAQFHSFLNCIRQDAIVNIVKHG